MSKQPPPAPTASAVGPCPTVIQIVGRPDTGSSPSAIAPPDHPDSIRTPSPEIVSILPTEIIYQIVNHLQIRDVLSMSQTCKRFYELINNVDFWRHRLMKDFQCYSVGIYGKSQEKLPLIKEAYKLTYSVDKNWRAI